MRIIRWSYERSVVTVKKMEGKVVLFLANKGNLF